MATHLHCVPSRCSFPPTIHGCSSTILQTERICLLFKPDVDQIIGFYDFDFPLGLGWSCCWNLRLSLSDVQSDVQSYNRIVLHCSVSLTGTDAVVGKLVIRRKGRQEMPTVSSVTSTIKTPENEEHGEAIVGRWSRLQSTLCPSSTTTFRDLSPPSS